VTPVLAVDPNATPGVYCLLLVWYDPNEQGAGMQANHA